MRENAYRSIIPSAMALPPNFFSRAIVYVIVRKFACSAGKFAQSQTGKRIRWWRTDGWTDATQLSSAQLQKKKAAAEGNGHGSLCNIRIRVDRERVKSKINFSRI
jgi:hypothetical protein